MCVLVWFRYDLRVADHPALWHAAQTGLPLLPVYIWEDDWESVWMGQPRLGPHRRQLMEACLAELQHRLQQLGAPLRVLKGDSRRLIPRLVQATGATAVYTHYEPAPNESATFYTLRQQLRSQGLAWHSWDGNSLYQLDDLPFPPSQVPDLFKQFRQRVEPAALIRTPLLAPHHLLAYTGAWPEEMLTHSLPRANTVSGGETAAQARLHHYLWESDAIATYRETRNGLQGEHFSSRLSPWLAQGCLSPRQVYTELRRYEQARTRNESTYWLFFELLWREYFRAVATKFGPRLFRPAGIMNIDIPWKEDAVHLRLWQAGQTGYPLVDAAMRELKATGWISNRARQVVASFFTKNLHLDWRLGAAWMERWLIDYDPCSHYGNWNYAAGVGNDGRGYRFFHVVKQGEQYDPEGAYVRTWVPELAQVPTPYIHQPWLLDPAPEGYPGPVTDLMQSAREGETAWKLGFKASGIHKRISRIRKFVR
ncbi:MAG: DASH family cryptochrome [Bacteroidetes bacterium]|jgi:deoxyribodipyrimidine photo-lyase|nr:DASH family cryptochrome [Bacteroidota bacterium]